MRGGSIGRSFGKWNKEHLLKPNVLISNMPKVEYSAIRHKLPFLSYTLPESLNYGRIKLLLGETIDYKFQRACAAEFIAMLFFVVICCGCAMVTLNLKDPNLMMVAASFGMYKCVLLRPVSMKPPPSNG
jgi:hypothetical protein